MKRPSPFLVIAISIGCGIAFATGAAFGGGVADFLLFAWIAGGVIGMLTCPAAGVALADPECRPSFGWVFWPTLVVATLGGAMGGPALAVIASVAVYIGSAVAVGLLARPRRRRLNWYRTGRCSSCGYDMAGLEAQTCPECGCNGRVRPYVRVPPDVLRS